MKYLSSVAIRLVVMAAMYLSMHVASHAVSRTIDNCTLPAQAPTEAVPFDLDNCELYDGDNITQLMDGIVSQWPSATYIRAPSRTMTLRMSYRLWTLTGAKVFMFLEDQDSLNKLTIQQIPVSSSCTGSACEGFWKLWAFVNFTTVKIGGPNLSLTFVGNHPGFGNCSAHQSYWTQTNGGTNANCDINKGLLDFRMDDGSTATLVDVRANVRYSQMYGLYMWGGEHYYESDPSDSVTTVNLAGVFYATSGVFLHHCCKDIWIDPDRTVLTDPYLRMIGWQGQMSSVTVAGRPVACATNVDDQVRGSAFGAYYSSTLRGGYTLEYGNYNFGQRFIQRMGTGVKDPFIVRLQDVGMSGPIEKACPYTGGCTVGARGRFIGDINYWKGDPHSSPDLGGTPLRFMRIVTLPPRFGNGLTATGVSDCAETLIHNPGGGDDNNFLRFENNFVSFPTRDWLVEFAGDWRTPADGGTWFYGQHNLVSFSWYEDTEGPSKSYRNGVRAASGTDIMANMDLVDTNSLSGPGSFKNITVSPGTAFQTCQANSVTNTNVTGTITISGSCGTTTISNVNFTGTARAVITIGDGSNVIASTLCVPAGSTIARSGTTGTLTYDGASKSLTSPYVISPASGCNPAAIADPTPQAPTGGVVQ